MLFIVLKFILPDYLVKENELITDSGIIQYTFMNKYPEHERLRTVYKNCLDVVLVGKPYYIRFTDALDSKYWKIINDTTNYSKSIQVKFQARLLQKNILYNPNEVLIDNKIIIPSDSKKAFLGWLVIVLMAIIIFCGYLFSLLWKQYRQKLYWEDKEISQESKWKLFMVWLYD